MLIFQPAPGDAHISSRLAAFGFYAGLSTAGQLRLADASTSLRFDGGEELLTEGSECQALLLVERGSVRVYKLAPSGKEITLYQVDPGESCVLGTSCVVSQKSYPAQAVVSGPTLALAVPAAVFRELYDSEAALREFVMQLFSRRFSNLMLLVEEVAFARMDERLAAFLLDKGVAGPGELRPVCLSHDEIASHLGTAREVISRLLQQFAEQGGVRLSRKRIEIVHPETLRKLANSEN